MFTSGKGKIAIKNSYKYGQPLNASDPQHVLAAQRYNDFELGLFQSAMFANVSWPSTVIETLGSALPILNATEMAMIYGSADFQAINLYCE